MKTEKIINSSSDRCLNIVANKVESLRINNDLENTVRMYDNGCIGVEGRLGNADFDDMTKSATAKLAQGIAYPETHDKAQTIEINTVKHIITEQSFVATINKLLARLEKENPQFLFSNKVQLNSSCSRYENSDGAKYVYTGNQFLISLSIKYKGSANIMDEFYGCESNYYDEEQICQDIKMKCDAFLNELPQTNLDEAVIIGDTEPLQHALRHFLAYMYFNNSSLFNGKLGQKLFDEKLSFGINTDPQKNINAKFFDAEGVVLPDYKAYLVKNGVFEKTVANKKDAADYKTDNLGGAVAPYDGIPVAALSGFDVDNTAQDLSDIVKGEAIYLSVSSGGDMTPSGEIGMPAIVAYLYKDGKLVGRLPEFTVSCNLFDAFGKDFVGVCENGLYKFGRNKYIVYKAKLVNKK